MPPQSTRQYFKQQGEALLDAGTAPGPYFDRVGAILQAEIERAVAILPTGSASVLAKAVRDTMLVQPLGVIVALDFTALFTADNPSLKTAYTLLSAVGEVGQLESLFKQYLKVRWPCS